MDKKQKMDLDTISKIDDDIIEKNTEKRIRLLRKKSKIVRNRTIAAIAAAALLLTALVSMFLILSGRPDAKQVPIYQGMTAHAYNNDSTVNAGGMSISFLSAGSSDQGFDWLKNGDNGNHNGHDKNGKDTSAETEAESSSLEIGEQEIVFYTRPNTDFYIKVHISNPDNYEILSFTLNGKKYSSYMFEEGSDMENLILKCNVGDAEGIIEYTIDAIKYVDGTEIKDVVMEGNRTIKIGVYTDNQPASEITEEKIGLDSIGFDVSLSDELGMIEMSGGNVWVELLKDGNVVSRKDISNFERENVIFESLEEDTAYECRVVAHYNSLDGQGMADHVLLSRKFRTESIFVIDIKDMSQDGVEFLIEWNDLVENKTLTSLTLFRGGEKVRDIPVTDTRIDGLLSNNTYMLVAQYDLNDGSGSNIIEKSVDIKTLAKAEPTVNIFKGSVTQTSIGFDISVIDIDGVGRITKLEIIQNGNAQSIADLSTREFKGLLCDNTYTVKVTYTYDLNDGSGSNIIEKSVDIKTLAKAEPTFKFKDMTSDTYAIKGSYDHTDTDKTLVSYSVKLYSGEVLVARNTDMKIEFNSLNSYTKYTVAIEYQFDLNDGKGVQEKRAEYSLNTRPYINVTRLRLANTQDVLYEGCQIFLDAQLDNPDGARVTHAIVNGRKYEIQVSLFEADSIAIEFWTDESMVGDVSFTLEGLSIMMPSGDSYDVMLEDGMSVNAYIQENVNISEMEFTNESFESAYWFFPSDKKYFKITIDSHTPYEVTHLELKAEGINGTLIYTSEEIIKISDYEYAVEYPHSASGNAIWSVYVIGESQSITMEIIPENVYVRCHELGYDDVVYISNAQEFADMLASSEEGRYYELTADIDLSGMKWTPCDFNGVLNGKGYVLKNMSLVGSIREGQGFGLFKTLYGVVTDLRFENAYVMTTLSDVSGGLIADRSEKGIVINCSIDGTSEISVTGDICAGGFIGSNAGIIKNCVNYASITFVNGGYVGGITGEGGTLEGCINYASITSVNGEYAGGITGGGSSLEGCINYGDMVFFKSEEHGSHCGGIAGIVAHAEDCFNYGTLTVRSNETIDAYRGYTGGIAGSADTVIRCQNYGDIVQDDERRTLAGGISGGGHDGILKDCVNYGSISHGSGILGSRLSGGTCIIENCINFGDVSGYSVSGIFYFGGSTGLNVFVKNCVNVGKVSDTSERQGAGIILGEPSFGSEKIVAENCYTNVLYAFDSRHEGVQKCSLDQLNDSEFYTKTLGWSEDVWDFSELDFENGKYPKLK